MTTVPIESTHMLQKVVDFPEQFSIACRLTKDLKITMPVFADRISSIVILGMGGSGIAGDLARVLLRHSEVPVHVCKNSVPPHHLTSSTLVIAITYSGKTQETLDALSAALSNGSKAVVITSSSELHSIFESRKVLSVLVPKNDYPRASLAYLLIPLLAILQKIGIMSLTERDFDETLSVLEELRTQCHPEKPIAANPARILAHALVDKFPIIYGEFNFTDVVALRFKQLLNENSKIHCYCDAFPELLHNEIEGWQSSKRSMNYDKVLLIMRDAVHEQNIKITEKIESTRALVESKGTKVFELWTKGKSELARLLSISYTADFVSVYLAEYTGTDPNTIPNIEYLKKKPLLTIEKEV